MRAAVEAPAQCWSTQAIRPAARQSRRSRHSMPSRHSMRSRLVLVARRPVRLRFWVITLWCRKCWRIEELKPVPQLGLYNPQLLTLFSPALPSRRTLQFKRPRTSKALKCDASALPLMPRFSPSSCLQCWCRWQQHLQQQLMGVVCLQSVSCYGWCQRGRRRRCASAFGMSDPLRPLPSFLGAHRCASLDSDTP